MDLKRVGRQVREFKVHIDFMGAKTRNRDDLLTQMRAFGNMDNTLQIQLRPKVAPIVGKGRGLDQSWITKRFLLQKTLIQVMRELPPTKE